MSDKRIIDLEAKQTLGSGDYLAADSAQGTYKVDANTNIMTPLTNVRNNVANSSASPDKYSSSTAYKVGDMVIHDDILYICTTACSAASWAVNSACFTAKTLASVITQLNSDLNTGNYSVDLSGYTSSYYTAPCDGYAFMYMGASSINSAIQMDILQKSTSVAKVLHGRNDFSQADALFVRKGTRIKCTFTNNPASAVVEFRS